MSKPTFKPVADCALLIELGTKVDDAINRQIVNLDRRIAAADIRGISEVVPALVNLLIVFDPIRTDHKAIQTAVEKLFPLDHLDAQSGTNHTVKVCYEEGLSPDLDQVSNACGMSREAVINAHLANTLRVSMYGFAPGFAYLTGIDETIQVPRKTAPVRDIPKGSVMIAGPQCLVTTVKMPTGWSIIGRSDADIMTEDPKRPFLYEVGDTVTFKRVTRDELDWVAP